MKSRANQVYATASPPRGHCILPGLCGGMGKGKASTCWHLGCSEVSYRCAVSVEALQLMKQQYDHQWKFQNQKIGIIYSLKTDTNYISYSNTRHLPFKWNGSGILVDSAVVTWRSWTLCIGQERSCVHTSGRNPIGLWVIQLSV